MGNFPSYNPLSLVSKFTRIQPRNHPPLPNKHNRLSVFCIHVYEIHLTNTFFKIFFLNIYDLYLIFEVFTNISLNLFSCLSAFVYISLVKVTNDYKKLAIHEFNIRCSLQCDYICENCSYNYSVYTFMLYMKLHSYLHN